MALCIATAANPAVSFAAKMVGAERYTLPETETISDDVYAAGGEILIRGNTQHDFHAAGGEITLDGNVGEDATLAGGEITISGEIGDDMRAAGGTLEINGVIVDEVLVAGADIIFGPDAAVGGTLHAYGNRVILEGLYTSDVDIKASIVEINATIEGETSIYADNIVIGDRAQLFGTTTYRSEKEAFVSDGATVTAPLIHTEAVPSELREGVGGFFEAFAATILFLTFVSFLIVSLLLVLVFPAFTHRIMGIAVGRAGLATGVGFASWILLPIVAFLLLISVFGFVLSFGVFTSFITLWMLASVMTNIMAGALLSQLITKNAVVDWKWTIIGALALEAVIFVPFIGWLVNLLVMFAVFGALVIAMYESWWLKRKEFPPEEPATTQEETYERGVSEPEEASASEGEERDKIDEAK